jgi:hypothetical protein
MSAVVCGQNGHSRQRQVVSVLSVASAGITPDAAKRPRQAAADVTAHTAEVPSFRALVMR